MSCLEKMSSLSIKWISPAHRDDMWECLFFAVLQKTEIKLSQTYIPISSVSVLPEYKMQLVEDISPKRNLVDMKSYQSKPVESKIWHEGLNGKPRASEV